MQETGTPREDPLITPGKPPAKGAPATPPPGVVDLSQLTLGPCTLVPSDQAAGAQVVQLHLQSAGPLPDTLQAAATAAGQPASLYCFAPKMFESSFIWLQLLLVCSIMPGTCPLCVFKDNQQSSQFVLLHLLFLLCYRGGK